MSLLPQSVPYGTLSRRLAAVGALQMSLNFCEKYGNYTPNSNSNYKKSKNSKFGFFGGSSKKKSNETDVCIDLEELKARFVLVQERHYKHRCNMLNRYTLPQTSEEVVQSVFGSNIASSSKDIINVHTVPYGTLIQ